MKSFWRLYVYELQGLWLYLISGPVAATIFVLYLATRKDIWPLPEIIDGATLLLYLMSMIALIFGAWVVEREWDKGTAYQLLALPVGGYAIFGAKFAAVCTIFLLPLVFLLTGLLALVWPSGITFIAKAPLFCRIYHTPVLSEAIVCFGVIAPLILWSGLVGLFLRVVGLWLRPLRVLTGIIILIGYSLSYRLFTLLEKPVAYTIPWPGGFYVRGNEVMLFYTALPLLPVVAALGLSILLFVAAGWLLEHRLEV